MLTASQQALVERHVRLVRVHLRRFVPTPAGPTRDRDYDDLFQEGCVALARAAGAYDARRDGPFAPYALFRIRARIHTALHEAFSTVRVPTRVQREAKRAAAHQGSDGSTTSGSAHDSAIGRAGPCAALPRRSPLAVEELGDEEPQARPAERAADRLDGVADGNGTRATIGGLLRQRYESAVRAAVELFLRRYCRRADAPTVLARLARDRLLVPDGESRTSLRQIARSFGLSIGRAVAWEAGLKAELRRILEDDAEVTLLRRWASRHRDRTDAPMDAEQAATLASARERQLREKVAELSRGDQVRVLVALADRAARDLGEWVVELFRGIDRPELPGALVAQVLDGPSELGSGGGHSRAKQR